MPENKLPNELVVYFDGLCEPVNPGGVACYGYVITYYEDDGEWHNWAVQGGFIEEGPKATNNVAEWCALGFALRYLLDNKWSGKLTVKGDSQLVINQLLGEWACNKDRLVQFRDRCLEYLEKIGHAQIKRAGTLIVDVQFSDQFKAIWIPREENKQADLLSQQAYEQRTGQKVLERKIKCPECGRICIRMVSRTAKNPNRLFMKCDKCGKFTWLS